MPELYTDTYREKCFQAWYAAGRSTRATDVLEVIPVDELGRKPNKNVIYKWMNETWNLRADELDAKAVQLADDSLIIQKAEMLKAQAIRGETLQKKGIEYIETEGFDSAASAVQAVIRGAELERVSRGVGDLLVRMAKMSEGDLKEEIMKRLQILSDDSAIDAEVKENVTEEADETAD